MSERLAWLKHLRKRRGRQVFAQALRMYRFHRLPFEKIVGNILEVTQKHGVGYTFPTVASVATQKPELLRMIVDSGSEVAVHGYRHVKYPLISAASQENDVRRALRTYARLGIKVSGFRAPYNAYDENTPGILDRAGFLWDGGIGYSPVNRGKKEMFRVKIDGRDSSFVCIPLNFLSDDLMIDEYGYTPRQMVNALNGALDDASKSGSVVMFDLHPIRVGQPEYVVVLDRIISHGKSLGGWFPTVSEAIGSGENGDWKGNRFCCLLTGDIDNFYFSDYLKRLG
ncbi:MAG TPA: polysaccharide deacetylase family protein [Nitrososphaerales archaeon]|nr:polysaccharide deacetylase family protein [Nitrososphaerales archaeon]